MSTKLTPTCPRDFVFFSKSAIYQGIHERFEDQARLYPNSIAIKSRDASYSYFQTNGFANSITEKILSAVGGDLAQAAIIQPNAPEIIISILASLKARKAYVPLDPNYPKERLRIMLDDSDARILLTDDRHVELAEELAGKKIQIINTSRIECRAETPNPRVACDPLDRAYILYTSGSTGRPKGIAFLHRNLLHTTMCLTNKLFFAKRQGDVAAFGEFRGFGSRYLLLPDKWRHVVSLGRKDAGIHTSGRLAAARKGNDFSMDPQCIETIFADSAR